MIGKTLAHFEVTGLLGKGGMGEVYRAHDPRAGRDVALKILPEAFASDPERVARFRREARTLASLSHPNIATLYGVEDDAGTPFLVMELAEGEDLQIRLERGPVALDDALDIALQLAEGMEEAHEKGVIHRDLKPANIMIQPDGRVKILDFGLARAFDGPQTATGGELAHSPTITAVMTQAGTILGTAGYMSPEQAKGREIDQRSDLWAFGVILWEMLAGRTLFADDSVSETIANVLRTDVPWDVLPSSTPHGVRRLIERCLERDVRNRLRDIGEARIRIQKWRQDPATLQESFGISGAITDPTRKTNRLPWGVAAIATAAALFFGLRGNDAPPVTPDPWQLEIRLQDDENMDVDGYAAMGISPDGTFLMWSTAEGLHIKHRASSETRLIPGSRNIMAATFSPDSRWIAFAHNGTLFRVSVTGGSPIAICKTASSRGIAWVDDETIVLAPGFATGLQQVSMVDGSTRDLTGLRDNERSHRWPSAIPGQRAVLFMTQFPGRHYQDSDIEIVSLDDGSRRTLHRGGAYPRYAPTGHLIFARESSLLAIPFDPASGTVDGLAIPVLDKVLARVGDQELDDGSVQYGFDHEGTLLYRSAISSSAQRSRLAWLDLETGTVDPFGDIGLYEGVSISPDGQRIAVRRGEGTESQIIILEAATGAERALTNELGMKYAGDWSHDSRSYYWTQGNAGGTGVEAVRADVGGSRPAEVAVTFSNLGFVSDVSPDGNAMLVSYMTPEHSYDLGYVDLASGNPEVLTYVSTDRSDVEGQFHPDSRLVLYDDRATDLSHLMIRRFPDTGERWQVSSRNAHYDEHHWSADGSAVIVREGAWLKAISVDSRDGRIVVGAPKDLIEHHGLVRLLGRDLAIHPDGKRALILAPESATIEDPKSRIILRTGWFEELERLAGTK